MKTYLPLAAIVALSACAPPTRYLAAGLGPDRDPLGTHARAINVGNASGLDLRMRDGSARIIAGSGDSIRVRLRCAEHWTIEVPQALDVVISADVANIGVSGITGDVIATVDVGNVTIREAGASALARVKSVGDAIAESETTTYAEAMAKADVGRTELLVDGHRVNVRRSPGPGGRISLTGSGRDRVVAETGVGNARVLLTRKQE